MFKHMLGLAAVAMLTIAGLASGQPAPPASEQAKRIEVMVNKAAALVEKQGKAAFSEFRKRDSEWWFGNTYLFAYDQKLNVLLNPASRREREPIPVVRRTPMAKPSMMSFSRSFRPKGQAGSITCSPNPGRLIPHKNGAT